MHWSGKLARRSGTLSIASTDQAGLLEEMTHCREQALSGRLARGSGTLSIASTGQAGLLEEMTHCR